MDGRINNSGTKGNKGGGRLKRCDEELLITRIDDLIESDEVLLKLKELIQKGNIMAIKIYLDRRWGAVSKGVDEVAPEVPLFNLIPTIRFVKTEDSTLDNNVNNLLNQ